MLNSRGRRIQSLLHYLATLRQSWLFFLMLLGLHLFQLNWIVIGVTLSSYFFPANRSANHEQVVSKICKNMSIVPYFLQYFGNPVVQFLNDHVDFLSSMCEFFSYMGVPIMGGINFMTAGSRDGFGGFYIFKNPLA